MTAALTIEKYNTDFCLKSIIDKIYPIGKPFTTLSDNLNDNEIWLEGAEVSKTAYPLLYLIYGDKYGTPENDENFVLPDFRGRVLQGADGFGYLEAGLPEIYGYWSSTVFSAGVNNYGGCVTKTLAYTNLSSPSSGSSLGRHEYEMYASLYNSIYGNSETVQPPAIKVRVKTRYA